MTRMTDPRAETVLDGSDVRWSLVSLPPRSEGMHEPVVLVYGSPSRGKAFRPADLQDVDGSSETPEVSQI